MGKAIERHYTTDNLLERIFGALVMTGRDPFSLTVDDLASVDQFHSRGRQSTEELAQLAQPAEDDRVLDVGCGLGGSVRFLAHRFGCRVCGVDLTTEYIRVAEKLTELVGLAHRCSWVVGSATDLPFDNDSFDIVWTEHAQMNIEDKSAMYRELARVLKPHGRLVFHDIFAGNTPIIYPVPWAENAAISFLCTEQDARHLIASARLQLEVWENKDQQSIEAFSTAVKQLESDESPALGVHLLMGDNARTKIENYLKNLKAGAITVAMGVAIKNPDFL